MQGKRESASRVFGTLGLTHAAGTLRSAAVRDLRVLAYHRVLPRLDEMTFASDVELVSALEAEFEWQMAYLARNFMPVTTGQVVAALLEGEPLPRRAVMVTFDDGFRDNYEVAFPVLKRQGMPALFFVATGYIGGREMFWFDRVVYLILRTSANRIQLDVLALTLELTPSVAARRGEAMRVLAALKRVSETDRVVAIEQLADVAGVPFDMTAAPSLPMDWAQVREMAGAGMEFGSHSVTHPILSRIADSTHLRDELAGSKARIERETGRAVTTLAYPVGGPDSVNAQVLAMTGEAGYRLAFTYQPGVNKLASAAPLLLKRIHVERYTSRRGFEAALQLPEVFAST